MKVIVRPVEKVCTWQEHEELCSLQDDVTGRHVRSHGSFNKMVAFPGWGWERVFQDQGNPAVCYFVTFCNMKDKLLTVYTAYMVVDCFV